MIDLQLMSFFTKIFAWIPNPMKNIRRHLNIEQQWQQFRHHIRPHRYKIVIAIFVVSYPLYRQYTQLALNYSKNKAAFYINQWLGVKNPPFQITQNFIKNLLGSIFNDSNIKSQGLQFVNSIIQQQKFVGDILNLLVSALKNDIFMQVYHNEAIQSLQESSKHLVLNLLQDEDIKKCLKSNLTQILQSSQVKEAIIKLIQSTFTQQRSIQTIVQLLQKGISNDEVREALSGTINYSIQQLLKDDEFMSQLKIFGFFLLRKFQNDDEIKNMMDILVVKGLGLSKKKKTNKLQKLLKQIQHKNEKDEALL